MNSKVYKWCAVPQCTNTSIKTPNKLFIYVPHKKTVRDKWLKLARRDPAGICTNSPVYFCEDHFDLPNDMENYMQYCLMGSVSQVRMKPECIPKQFACQPDRKTQTSDSNKTLYKLKKGKVLGVCQKPLQERSMVTENSEVIASGSSEARGRVILPVCRVCLRAKLPLQKMNKPTEEYYIDICNVKFAIIDMEKYKKYNETYLCCTHCERDLRNNLDFTNKCRKSFVLLQQWAGDSQLHCKLQKKSTTLTNTITKNSVGNQNHLSIINSGYSNNSDLRIHKTTDNKELKRTHSSNQQETQNKKPLIKNISVNSVITDVEVDSDELRNQTDGLTENPDMFELGMSHSEPISHMNVTGDHYYTNMVSYTNEPFSHQDSNEPDSHNDIEIKEESVYSNESENHDNFSRGDVVCNVSNELTYSNEPYSHQVSNEPDSHNDIEIKEESVYSNESEIHDNFSQGDEVCNVANEPYSHQDSNEPSSYPSHEPFFQNQVDIEGELTCEPLTDPLRDGHPQVQYNSDTDTADEFNDEPISHYESIQHPMFTIQVHKPTTNNPATDNDDKPAFEKVLDAYLLYCKKETAPRAPAPHTVIPEFVEENILLEHKEMFHVKVFSNDDEAKAEVAARRSSLHYLCAKHRCDKCYLVFRCEREQLAHIHWHKRLPYICTICQLGFVSEKFIMKHWKEMHLYRFDCKICEQVLYSIHAMILHYNKHKKKMAHANNIAEGQS